MHSANDDVELVQKDGKWKAIFQQEGLPRISCLNYNLSNLSKEALIKINEAGFAQFKKRHDPPMMNNGEPNNPTDTEAQGLEALFAKNVTDTSRNSIRLIKEAIEKKWLGENLADVLVVGTAHDTTTTRPSDDTTAIALATDKTTASGQTLYKDKKHLTLKLWYRGIVDSEGLSVHLYLLEDNKDDEGKPEVTLATKLDPDISLRPRDIPKAKQAEPENLGEPLDKTQGPKPTTAGGISRSMMGTGMNAGVSKTEDKSKSTGTGQDWRNKTEDKSKSTGTGQGWRNEK